MIIGFVVRLITRNVYSYARLSEEKHMIQNQSIMLLPIMKEKKFTPVVFLNVRHGLIPIG